MTRLSAATIVDLETPRDLHISPDGKLAVYVTQTTGRKESAIQTKLWLAEVGKENSSKPLTDGKHHDTSPSFSPDASRIAFLSDRDSKEGTMNLYFLTLSEPDQIRKAIPDSDDHGPIEGFKWNHKGDKIALNIRPKADPSVDIKVYGENIRYRNLWILDVSKGKLDRLVDENADVNNFDWSLDGEQIVYSTQADTETETADYGLELKIVDVSTKRSTPSTAIEHNIRSLQWSADGIFINASYELKGLNRSAAILKLNGTSFDNVAFGKINDAVQMKKVTNRIVAVVNERMRTQIRTLDDSVVCDVVSELTDFDAAFDEQDKATVVLIRDSVGTPSDVYSIVDGVECKLSQHGDEVAGLKLGTAHIVEYEEDGIPYNGCYAVPQALQSDFDNRKPLPTFVAVHGGPYARPTNGYDALGFFRFGPYLLGKGYLILSPNYRGGIGHGDAYANAVHGNPAVSYEDVVWLVKKGIEEGRIDKDRVAIGGWSQGGFITYQAVARDSNFHFAAAVAGAGVSDWYVTTAGSDLTRMEGTWLRYMPWDKEVTADQLIRDNPIHDAKEVKTPLLMLHGEQDARVSPLNPILFAKALKVYKKDFEMVMYPREDHGVPPKVFERAHFIDLLERLGRFVDKHLKG